MNDELPYLAGFFDAKGSIGLQNGKHLVVSINQKTEDTLLLYKKLFGGSISTQFTYSIYQITRQAASSLLGTLLPYLRLKKPLSEVMIEYQSLVGFQAEDVIKRRTELLETYKLLRQI